MRTTSPGLHVHRSERTDVLLAGLAAVLAMTPADPFDLDLVAVPTPGIERFISQGLGSHLGTSNGHADGVCANVTFPSPTSLVDLVVAQALEVDPGADPWQARRAVWPLLAVIDREAGQPWCARLARHLGATGGADTPDDAARPDRRFDDAARIDRRFAVAARLAALFESYSAQRPAMLLDWADGRDLDGAGAAIPLDLAWQPELWRQLRAEIGVPSPAERLTRACRAVMADPTVVDLPGRLSIFGPTRLPDDQLRVLAALAHGREVHLWIADASPTTWTALGAPGRGTQRPPRRRSDSSGELARHPLARSLGRDSREMRLRLAALEDAPALVDVHLPAPLAGGTLLGRLQQQLRDDLDPWSAAAQEGPMVLAREDRSLQVHGCHGQSRQAEVVREVVLGLLADDPTLEPRDILIMCPDLDTFAPLLSAAFSEPIDAGRAGTGPPGGSLRVRIADRTPEQSNDVLEALGVLLELVSSRMELSTVLDFAGRPPVRARFGWDDDALARLAELAERAGVRWGLDGATRAQHQVPVTTGTWSWGMDRLLLGAAMSQQGLAAFGGILPVDDVQGGDVTSLGSLAELLTRLGRFRDATTGAHPLEHWISLLTAAMADLMAACGAQAWQGPNALSVVHALNDTASGYATDVDLRLADVRWLLAGVLAGRATRSNFRTGDLTVCGLVPMRSVPHRVICVVGLDDGAFPRSTIPDGDDVLARDPLVGERDPRSEDRQLLLDALVAATEHLVITYTGADDRTNEPRPPCVPLGELLDTVDAMAVTAAGSAARQQVLTAHPLQPFDPRNFTRGALGRPGPFSHDPAALAAARTAVGARAPAEPFLVGDLPPLPLAELSVRDLSAFLVSPPAAFLRTRLGLSLRGEDEPPSERIPIEPDSLERWAIGARALDLVLHDAPPGRVAAAEQMRGELPPGALGVAVMAEVGTEVTQVADRVTMLRAGLPGRQVRVHIDLPGGIRLIGTVPDVHGERIVRGSFARSRASHRLALWPELLAAAATEPGRGWEARLVTRDGGVVLRAPDHERCLDLLAELIELYVAGMRSPLPLVPESALKYAQRRATGKAVSLAARAAKEGGWARRHSPESELPEVQLLWGTAARLEDLLAHRPRPDERWYPDEPSRFGTLARRIWEPILAAGGTQS